MWHTKSQLHLFFLYVVTTNRQLSKVTYGFCNDNDTDGATQHINHALDVSREEVGGKTHSNEVTTAIGAGDSDGGDEFSHTTIWSASNFVGGILTLLSP